MLERDRTKIKMTPNRGTHRRVHLLRLCHKTESEYLDREENGEHCTSMCEGFVILKYFQRCVADAHHSVNGGVAGAAICLCFSLTEQNNEMSFSLFSSDTSLSSFCWPQFSLLIVLF